MKKMQEAGFEPDGVTYSLLMTSASKRNDHETVWATYVRQRAAGIKPTAQSVSMVAWSCLRHWRIVSTDAQLASKAALRVNMVEPEWAEWASRAEEAYTEALAAGVKVRSR